MGKLQGVWLIKIVFRFGQEALKSMRRVDQTQDELKIFSCEKFTTSHYLSF
jgi:hypothetical protein